MNMEYLALCVSVRQHVTCILCMVYGNFKRQLCYRYANIRRAFASII